MCPEQVELLGDYDVALRWTALFKGPILLQQFLRDGDVSPAHRETLDSIINTLRSRLGDLSWFMKCLNEPIARMANKEDGCTGHFWEARFKSQALYTEQALLAAMAYVDLNPVRAKIAETPEESEHTSLRERVKPVFSLQHAIVEQFQNGQVLHTRIFLKPLQPFQVEQQTPEKSKALPISENEYLGLVDWTGRRIRSGKRGAIAQSSPLILQRLSLPPDDWLSQSTQFERIRHTIRRPRAS